VDRRPAAREGAAVARSAPSTHAGIPLNPPNPAPMRRLVGYGVGLLLVLSVWADEGISPLAPRYEASLERPTRTRGVYAIRNVTVHPITTPPIEGAMVLIRDGKIAAVGKNLTIPRGAVVYDGKGNHLYPAQILGLAHRLGSIEVGKDANLVLVSGDPLDIRSTVIQVWIAGRPIEMTSKHIRLYERYRKRPK
jgi:hypothetical protein